MSTTEDTVQTETTATTESTPKGADAFKAARASIAAQSEDQGQKEAAPPADDTTDKPPAEEPEKVTDQPPEVTADPDALLTPEELSKLSPKERAKAEKWQAKLTQESQRQAAVRKDLEGYEPLAKALKTNPMAALEEIAKQNGLTLTKPSQDTKTVEDATANTLAALPEELQFLKPIFDQFGQTILASVKGELEPLKQAQTEMISQAAAAETEGTMKAFDAKYPGWRKHESAMVALAQKIIPTAGAMTADEYMETLYKIVAAPATKAEQVKEAVKQINKSVAAVEPNTPGVSDSRVEHAMPPDWAKMTNSERMKASFEAASKGIVWKK